LYILIISLTWDQAFNFIENLTGEKKQSGKKVYYNLQVLQEKRLSR